MTEKLFGVFSPHGTPPSVQTNLHTHTPKLMPTHSAHGSFQALKHNTSSSLVALL